MPRAARNLLQRGCFHVLNRGNHGQPLFHQNDDYAFFIDLLAEAQTRFEVALWGYCLVGNHWHLVAEVERIDALSSWIRWICTRQARQFHRERPELGGGHVYQGRYKSFPIQNAVYLGQVLRYVESNPVRAGLVEQAQDWLWTSLSRAEIKRGEVPLERPRLQTWVRDADWKAAVHQPLEEEPLRALRQSLTRGTPLGDPAWVQRMVKVNGLESTVRPQGRPRKLISKA